MAAGSKAHKYVVYAVTDRRAIVADFGGDITIRTFFPKRLHDIWRVRGKDGLESVVMRNDLTLGGDDDVRKEPAGFLDMEDADDAVNAYRKLRDGST